MAIWTMNDNDTALIVDLRRNEDVNLVPKVGINIDVPLFRLHVNGSVKASSLTVNGSIDLGARNLGQIDGNLTVNGIATMVGITNLGSAVNANLPGIKFNDATVQVNKPEDILTGFTPLNGSFPDMGADQSPAVTPKIVTFVDGQITSIV